MINHPKKFSNAYFWFFTTFLTVCLLAGTSFAKPKVIVAPVRGQTQYPGLVKGLRYVLMSDLEKGGHADVVSLREMEGLFQARYSTEDLQNISKKIYADVAVTLYIKEDGDKFDLSVRAYELNNSFNIGSEIIRGSYSFLKTFQDQLTETVHRFLFVSLSSEQVQDFEKGHSANQAAIQKYGEGYEKWGNGEYVNAAEEFEDALKTDKDFKLAQHFRMASGNLAIKREKNPAKIGKAYEMVGKYDQAYSNYSTALKKNPKDLEALLGQGRILMRQRRYSEALKRFQAAKTLSPMDGDIRFELSRALSKTNQTQLAFMELKKAKQLGATTYEIHDNLASIYMRQGDKRRASKEYLSAADKLEKNLDYGRARQYYTRANNAQRTIEGIRKQASLLIQQKEYGTAIALLKKGTFIDSTDPTLYSELGYAYYLAGQRKAAYERFKKSYSLDKNGYKANLYLGILYMELMEDNKTAISYLQNAIKISPGNQEPYKYLSQIYQNTERVGDALELLTKLIKLHPYNSEYHKQIGDLYTRTENWDQAVNHYRKAIDLRGDYVEAWEGLGLAYKSMGWDKEAMSVVEKLYSIDASNNLLVRGGLEFLSGLTKAELIQMARDFPKVYSTQFINKVWINNVAVLKLLKKKFSYRKLLEWLKPYKIDLTRIKRDLEVALYSKYRVVRSKGLLKSIADSVDEDQFAMDDETMQLIAKDAFLDGLFAFKISNYKRGEVTSELSVNLHLLTAGEVKRFTVEPVTVKYLNKEIFVFNPTAILFYVLLAFLFGTPIFYLTVYRSWVRGRGTLVVRINYDAEKESFLTLKLSTKEIKDRESLIEIVTDKAKHEKEKYKRHLKQKGSWVRNMVGRTTVFEKIPAKDYLVYLFGTIEDTGMTKKTVGKYSMMQKVKVQKNVTKEILFQLEKEMALVKVFVSKGEVELSGVELKIEGTGELKYSKAEVGTFFDLKPGKHVLKATYDGKTYVREIDVVNLEDKIVHINLEEDELAEGTAANWESTAEQMIMSGDLEGAAEIYKRYGETEKSNKLYVEFYQKNGMDDKAAELYEQLKKYGEAAEIYNKLGEVEKANRMFGLNHYYKGDYEEALKFLRNSGDHKILSDIYKKLGKTEEQQENLAMQYLASGQKLEAAQEFEKAQNWRQAGEIYEGLEDYSKAGYMNVKDGNFALAGELFAKAGDKKRAAVSFEKAKQYDAAVMFYRDLGEKGKVAELLFRGGKYIESVKEYTAQGLLDEAIKICQQVPQDYDERTKLLVFLGFLFQKKGIDDFAIKSYDQAWEKDPKAFSKNSLYDYANLLDKKNNLKKAIEIYEFIIRIDLHFKDVTQKLNAAKVKAQKLEEQEKLAKARKDTMAQTQSAKPARYEMLEELGRGAMGIVYKAKDTLLDRIVAYKTLPSVMQGDEQALESLLKEAKTVAQLSHPNIVTVFDVGMENGVYYITMEYVQGKTLEQVLKKVKRINLANFVAIAEPLCSVLDYAHKKNVVHRDVKPSNVILFPNKGVKLMDFGIAKILQKGGQDKTLMRGTPLYMAPEQITGEQIDNRTDIYALGATFYEMLSGTPPFTEGDVMYSHVHVDPKPIQELVPDIDQRLAAIVMKCLAKGKDNRFTGVLEINALLKKIQPSA